MQMRTEIHYNNNRYTTDLSKPIDISIPLKEGIENVNAFYAEPVRIEPVRAGSFVGDVKQGGSVNFKNVYFNPHGNGTHTECYGHISPSGQTINQSLQQFFFIAELVSIYPQKKSNGDRVIMKEQLIESCIVKEETEALIIRTLPNDNSKIQRQYSGTNPPYIHHEAVNWLVNQKNIQHLLIDLPSVDREEDEGKLLAHKAFWQYPDKPRKNATITEMVYVNNDIKDGLHLLNIQINSLESDATASKPVLYKLEQVLK